MTQKQRCGRLRTKMTSDDSRDVADDEAFWREMERMPDLQALVERAGRCACRKSDSAILVMKAAEDRP